MLNLKEEALDMKKDKKNTIKNIINIADIKNRKELNKIWNYNNNTMEKKNINQKKKITTTRKENVSGKDLTLKPKF